VGNKTKPLCALCAFVGKPFVLFVSLWEPKQNPFVGKKYNIMKITERAAAQLKNILEKHDSPEAGIKIYATQGCCGPSPGMDVAENPGFNDTQIEIDGINFFVANELLDKMENSLIELSPGGFRIHGCPKKNSCCD
jgi:iron-sulfur cluster assembly protein